MVNNHIHIIGAGSLGSFATLHLARLAMTLDLGITVWDEDKVAEHNLLNQLYRRSDVGRFKVEALQEIVSGLTGFDIQIRKEMVKHDTPLEGTVITLVDSMRARTEIFKACELKLNIPFYIDARSGGTGALVYSFDPRDPDCIDRYKRTLHSDSDGIPAPCADRLTTPILWLVAGVTGRLVTRYYGARIPRLEFVQTVINNEDLPVTTTDAYNDYSPEIK